MHSILTKLRYPKHQNKGDSAVRIMSVLRTRAEDLLLGRFVTTASVARCSAVSRLLMVSVEPG